MAADLQEQLTKYLTDAHAIEAQALEQLKRAPGFADEPELARLLREHYGETLTHERLVRERLRARGAEPSTLKEIAGRAGAYGFLLFARLQPDTPGKLASHAFAYEHMELAAYELLGIFAEHAGDEETLEVARRIRGEEESMAGRIEELFDRTVEASLRDVPRDDLREQLRKYLADAHAIEEQSVQLLERSPELAGAPELADVYAEHLEESRDHGELVAGRLAALGGSTSSLKDAVMRLGALNWGTFFQAQPDTPHKLAAFAFAFEHLEIAGYEQLKRVAERAEDEQTVELAERLLGEERAAAKRLADRFDAAARASLEAVGVAAG